MKIEHIALWVANLERMKDFYVQHFGGSASEPYCNRRTGFRSYFLSFTDGARLELMQKPGIAANANSDQQQTLGFVHLAFATGSALQVEKLTERLQAAGMRLLSAPRLTGDAYYESVLLDPEGNRIEITI
ncbi:glyoxalase/bleomycin resistance/extradiol dioxygenase family protein [Chitinimonas arctica]|uniref:Glyoxalase/bleomycin resistance/extradiol dioxygenase family protein n=1 Tax=Chitinimonas arctica TaxID=2594795 RepID=A0A516SFQ0_9NEIS|nr:VOC family protein [Chitinimonas arctica]QDQ26858.1 glyoxalase/bleomycin resistance/extradiol dioxygenase family protein [Chitinimonas arctica]